MPVRSYSFCAAGRRLFFLLWACLCCGQLLQGTLVVYLWVFCGVFLVCSCPIGLVVGVALFLCPRRVTFVWFFEVSHIYGRAYHLGCSAYIYGTFVILFVFVQVWVLLTRSWLNNTLADSKKKKRSITRDWIWMSLSKAHTYMHSF